MGNELNERDLAALKELTTAMVAEGRKVTDKLTAIYRDGINYAYNNQLSSKDRKKGWPAVQVNMIFPAIRQERAMLAQRKPAILPIALLDENKEKARFWKGSLQHRFEKTLDMPARCREAALDGKIFGWYIAKVSANKKARWNKTLREWVYDPHVAVIHPKFFGMDPNAERVEDAQYVYCRRRVPVSWALDKWDSAEAQAIIRKAIGSDPEGVDETFSEALGQELNADTETDRGTKPTFKDSNARVADLVTRSRGTLSVAQTNQDELDGRGSTVVITEVYFNDSEQRTADERESYDASELEELGAIRLEVGIGDENTDLYVVADPESPVFKDIKGFASRYAEGDPLGSADWPEKVTAEWREPVFPNGRVIFKVDDDILNPKKLDQVWDEDEWPFVIGVNEQLPHIPQGLNAVEMPRGAQDWVNVSASHLLNWVCYHGDPLTTVVGDPLKESKGNIISNVAGKILHLVKGQGSVTREPAPPLSPGLIQVLELMFRTGQDATGIHDPALGRSAKGDQTASELSILQQNMQVGIGLQMIFMDAWIIKIMERVACMDRKYMQAGDMVRLAGSEFKDKIDEFTDEVRDVEFDITLKVGMALPHAQERLKMDSERLKNLYPNNVEIDRVVLEAFEVENIDSVLQADAEYAEFAQWREEKIAQEQAQEQVAPGQGAEEVQ